MQQTSEAENKIIILESLLKTWQMQLKALQIIFKNYPVSSKIKVIKEYLKYSGKKQLEEIIDDLGIQEEKELLVSFFYKKKKIQNITALTGIPITSLRRKLDSICNYIIDKI